MKVKEVTVMPAEVIEVEWNRCRQESPIPPRDVAGVVEVAYFASIPGDAGDVEQGGQRRSHDVDHRKDQEHPDENEIAQGTFDVVHLAHDRNAAGDGHGEERAASFTP